MIIASRLIYHSGCERDPLHWYSIQDLICKFYDALKPNYQKLTSNYLQFYWTVIIIMVFWDYGAVHTVFSVFVSGLSYIYRYHGTLYHNAAAPAIVTKCKLFLHCCTVWKKYRQFIALATEIFFWNPKSVKNQRCRLCIFKFCCFLFISVH